MGGNYKSNEGGRGVDLFDEDVNTFEYKMVLLRERLTLRRTERQNANMFYRLYQDVKREVHSMSKSANRECEINGDYYTERDLQGEFKELYNMLAKELKSRKTTKQRSAGLLYILDELEYKAEMMEMLIVPNWVCERINYMTM